MSVQKDRKNAEYGSDYANQVDMNGYSGLADRGKWICLIPREEIQESAWGFAGG